MHVEGDETKTPHTKTASFNLKFETTPVEQVSKHRLLGVKSINILFYVCLHRGDIRQKQKAKTYYLY